MPAILHSLHVSRKLFPFFWLKFLAKLKTINVQIFYRPREIGTRVDMGLQRTVEIFRLNKASDTEKYMWGLAIMLSTTDVFFLFF